MSLPRYSEYKPSGVEWLGDVPVHWAAIRLRFICQCLDGQRIPLNAAQRSDKLGDIPYWGANSIVGYVDEALFDEDLVLLGEDGAPFFEPSKSVAFFSQGKVWPNNHVHVLRPTVRGTGTFITYVLNVTDYAQFIDGSTRDKLTQGSMNDIPIPWPPIAEQTQIAAFLDRETAKIDELVAEQRRLMELLKEKRQAVISHAVTQGLNPHAPMKPSGIEWLGKVPEHWELKRLKYLGEAITGLTYSPSDIVEDDTSGILVLRSSNVQGGVITFDDNVYVSAAIPKELVTQVGDILICSRNGSRALIGKNATIDETSSGLTFGAFMTVFRSRHSAYLSCVLNSPLFEFQSGAFMTSTINQLTIGVLNNFEVPLPPENERADIAAYLAVESAKFDTLTAEANRAIELLQERRSALISAAVTGKIDVRGIQALPQ